MELPPGLGARWFDPLRGLPACSLSDPAAELRRLVAADDGERELLELGGALVALRRRGFAWVAIARAVDRPLNDTLALARHYARRVAAELLKVEHGAAGSQAPHI